MIIFPAIDLKDGKAVRLRRGKMDEVTVFGEDPVEVARKWQAAGATWLHVVDLDGAVKGARVNQPVISAICQSVDIPVQVGGGIRTLEDANIYLQAGATRLIIGTAALENPAEFRKICQNWPGRIGVSLDAENGKLKTEGWVKESSRQIAEILPQLQDAAFIIHTDISRDGMSSGVNLAELEKILQMTNLPVIAAGGVANMSDLKNLARLGRYKNLAGVVSGRALYEGSLDLDEALDWLGKNT